MCNLVYWDEDRNELCCHQLYNYKISVCDNKESTLKLTNFATEANSIFLFGLSPFYKLLMRKNRDAFETDE